MAEKELDQGSTGGAWRVLVVEDEYFLADELRRALAEEGAQVIGPVPTVDDALAVIAAEESINVAVLDVRLRDEMVWPVVERLRERGVDYVFATGYRDVEILPAYRGTAVFRKPVDIAALVRHLLGRRTPAC